MELSKMTLPKAVDLGKWSKMPLVEQMANISSEVGRASKWKKIGKETMAHSAFIRALDLIDATIAVGRIDNPSMRDALLEELCRARDLFCEEYLSDDPSALSPSEKYFNAFAIAYAFKAEKAASLLQKSR